MQDDIDLDAELLPTKTENKDEQTQLQPQKVLKTNGPLSSPKLVTTPVGHPINPKMHQKRSNSTVPLDQFSCVGIDGFPATPDAENGRKDRERDRKEQELDDKEYFKHHKASPLSELQIADTRKPLTRVTDGTADSKYNYGSEGVITWLPEQMVSADETLRRAAEIFKQNAMRGDPESSHGRRLRELRGEWW